MILSAVVALTLALAGCRGEPAPRSEAPRSMAPHAVRPSPSPSTGDELGQTEQDRRGEDASVPHPRMEAARKAEASIAGPPLSRDAVVPTFRRWWATFSQKELASDPRRVTLDERIAAGTKPREEACGELAEHVRERVPAGAAELLYGGPSALDGRTDRCWWLHYDGLMGPGLGAALASDGQVLVLWLVLEG